MTIEELFASNAASLRKRYTGTENPTPEQLAALPEDVQETLKSAETYFVLDHRPKAYRKTLAQELAEELETERLLAPE